MAQILDQFGQPINAATLRQPQTQNLANLRSLQSEHDNHPARGLTPQRIHSIMRSAEHGDLVAQLELAQDMEERETQIFSELGKRKTGLLKLDWDVSAPDDATPQEEAQAEQAKHWLKNFKQFKRGVLWNLMDGIFKGFAAIEMTWAMSGEHLLPSFAPRPQRWLTLSEHRDTLHLRDGSAYGQPLQPYSWLLHVHPAMSGYPARQSLCRVLMFPYLYKNYSTRDLAEFLEIYGLPLRLGKYPNGATSEEKNTLLRAVTEIGHNAAGIIPQGMEIEFNNAAQGTQVPFEAMLGRMDAAISKAIIGQTLTSGEGQHGTQALGTVHNDIRLDILASDAELLSETITEQLIAPMVLLNLPGADPKRLPRFVLEVPEPEDLELMANALPKLAGAGVQIGVNWVARKLRIPALDPGEDALQGAAPPAAQAAGPVADPAKPPVKPSAKSAPKPPAKAGPTPEQALASALALLAAAMPAQEPSRADALDALTQAALESPLELVQGMVQPLLQALQSAMLAGWSAEQFAQVLPVLSAAMASDDFAEQVARSGFVAHLAGLANIDLQTGKPA